MPSPVEQRGATHRYMVVMTVLAVCCISLVIQLVSLQVFRGTDCRRKSDKQSVRMLWVPALRGKVFDRDMHCLRTARWSPWDGTSTGT